MMRLVGPLLPKVSVHRFSRAPFANVENYRRLVGDELVDEIDGLARELKGVRVCHIKLLEARYDDPGAPRGALPGGRRQRRR